MKFIEWYNSLGANMQFVFIFHSLVVLICLGMAIYSLVCFVRMKREQKRAREERAKERYLKWLQNSNSIITSMRPQYRVDTYVNFFLQNQKKLEEEMRKKGLDAYIEAKRSLGHFKGAYFIDEQRPEGWSSENLGKMQNGKEIKFTPEISNCFCGGKGELVKYTKCEGKDAYPMSYIACNSCGIQTKEYCAEEDNFVIEAWNKMMSGAHVEKGNSENDSDCV